MEKSVDIYDDLEACANLDNASFRDIRDLMSLLALPSLWTGQHPQEVVRILLEAVEHLLHLRFSLAIFQLVPDHTQFLARLDQKIILESETGPWWRAAEQWASEFSAESPFGICATPVGPLRVVKLPLGKIGTVFWGADDTTFPSINDWAVFQTAITLATAGIESTLALQTLQQQNQAKDEFLAVLGHELRNPMAPILHAAHLIQNEWAAKDEIIVLGQMIERQIQQMKSLVNDLLDVTRISQGMLELHPSAIDLNSVVENAIEQIRPLIEGARHTLRLHVPRDPVHVKGDHGRLVQVVANLLSNAAKYTPDQGSLELNIKVVGEVCVLIVSDNGIGIDAGDLQEIFKQFSRLSHSTERAVGGLGVGLAIVKKIVELHGGSVIALSEGLGRGSKFEVKLPLYKKPS